MSMDDVFGFRFTSLGVFYKYAGEVSNELEASILRPDDVVREFVSNFKASILHSLEAATSFNEATKEVTWQLKCFVCAHVKNLPLRQTHLVNALIVAIHCRQEVQRLLHIPVAVCEINDIQNYNNAGLCNNDVLIKT